MEDQKLFYIQDDTGVWDQKEGISEEKFQRVVTDFGLNVNIDKCGL